MFLPRCFFLCEVLHLEHLACHSLSHILVKEVSRQISEYDLSLAGTDLHLSWSSCRLYKHWNIFKYQLVQNWWYAHIGILRHYHIKRRVCYSTFQYPHLSPLCRFWSWRAKTRSGLWDRKRRCRTGAPSDKTAEIWGNVSRHAKFLWRLSFDSISCHGRWLRVRADTTKT